jgi:hypothetical protein
MKTLMESTRGVSILVKLNTDRFLVPLLIVAALFLSGLVLSHTMPMPG